MLLIEQDLKAPLIDLERLVTRDKDWLIIFIFILSSAWLLRCVVVVSTAMS